MKKKGFIYVGLMLALIAGSFLWINRQKEEAKAQVHEVKKMEPIHLTKAEFLAKVANFQTNPTEWKYLGDKPCIIDFYATWCGPCKMIAPILEAVATEYAGKVTVVKINIDENPLTPQHYGVRGIPTLMLFKDGEIEATKVGALSKSELAKFIDSNI